MIYAFRLKLLVMLLASMLLSCCQPKPGEKEVEAWVNEHPALWNGATDYDSLHVLVQPHAVRDSIESFCEENMRNIIQYEDTAQGLGKEQYWGSVQVIDSINRVYPKVQVGWSCSLRDESSSLTLYLDMTYGMDSACRSWLMTTQKVFP